MKIAKVLSTIAAMGIVLATTATSSSAAPTYNRNNTGNLIWYRSSQNFTLRSHRLDGGTFGAVTTNHIIKYDGNGKATCIPNNDAMSYQNGKRKYMGNRVYWYSEYRKNDGKGKISACYERTKMIQNDESISYKLSEGMRWTVFDNDITYFRFDVWPSDGGKVSTEPANKRAYSRRASTDVFET